MFWMNFLIVATYAFQLILICFFPVPSAGSTAEMLFKARRDSDFRKLHPAGSALQSIPHVIAMITATSVVIATALLPLIAIIFPQVVDFLFPIVKKPSNILIISSGTCLVAGNAMAYVAVRTLRSHTTFHSFGETTHLHTMGIYGYIRNPITLGLTLIYTGFVLAMPSAVMLVGWVVFLLNSNFRVTMEEEYLQRAFGEKYLRYRQRVGKYFPKIKINRHG